MLVKLNVDLTKYNPLYEKDSICHCDMVPFCHPNIKWQLCYNLRIGTEVLAVGEDGFEVIGEESDEKEYINDSKNQAEFAEQKLRLAEIIDNHDVTIIKTHHYGPPVHFFGLNIIDDKLIDDVSEKGEFESPEAQRIFSRFVADYCAEQKKNFLLYGKNGRNAFYKAYLNGKLVEHNEFPAYDLQNKISKFLATHFKPNLVYMMDL